MSHNMNKVKKKKKNLALFIGDYSISNNLISC